MDIVISEDVDADAPGWCLIDMTYHGHKYRISYFDYMAGLWVSDHKHTWGTMSHMCNYIECSHDEFEHSGFDLVDTITDFINGGQNYAGLSLQEYLTKLGY